VGEAMFLGRLRAYLIGVVVTCLQFGRNSGKNPSCGMLPIFQIEHLHGHVFEFGDARRYLQADHLYG
jgi:hypothetical protein